KPELCDRYAEFRGTHGDAEIAGCGHDCPAPDRMTLDHGNHRLRDLAQRRLQFFGSSIVTQGALRGRQLLPELAHIGPRDKDAVTGTGKHEYPQRAITR